jgi:hypothetical protein
MMILAAKHHHHSHYYSHSSSSSNNSQNHSHEFEERGVHHRQKTTQTQTTTTQSLSFLKPSSFLAFLFPKTLAIFGGKIQKTATEFVRTSTVFHTAVFPFDANALKKERY